MTKRSVISGTGSYLPAKILTNEALARMVDTSDEWIRERTGIHTRHILAEGETTSDMAVAACERALAAAGYSAGDIDGIVVATSTPDCSMPSVATKVQQKLGFTGAAVDVSAACTGFIYALATAHGWLQMGLAQRVLVVGAEAMSKIVNWNDRGTCILFGDGAGAVVLEVSENKPKRGIHALFLHANGALAPLLGTDGGVASSQTAGHLFMSGQEVFRHGVEKMAAATTHTLSTIDKTVADIDWLIAHQANARMIQKIAKNLSVPEEKCVVTVPFHGNTSAASIPLALDTAVRDGRVQPGHLIAMPALGAGLTWGACVLTY